MVEVLLKFSHAEGLGQKDEICMRGGKLRGHRVDSTSNQENRNIEMPRTQTRLGSTATQPRHVHI